jgi:ribonucleotide reductase alpha subunit
MTQIIETAESNQKNSFAGKFKINIDHKKDENLSVFGKAVLKDRYLLTNEN